MRQDLLIEISYPNVPGSDVVNNVYNVHIVKYDFALISCLLMFSLLILFFVNAN